MPRKKTQNSTAFLPWCHDSTYIQKRKNGTYEKVKRFVSLPHSLLQNKTFLSLSPTSVALYIHMLDWACQQQEITYPYSLAHKLNLCSNKTFYKCIDELEAKGFIVTIEKGSFNHQPNKYKFIEDWKNKS